MRLLALACLLALSACPSQTATATDSDAQVAITGARAEFDAKYQAFVARMNQYDMKIRSDGVYADLPEFQAIVAMGKAALPFVFETIAAGDFKMNEAAELITGVDVLAPLRDDPPWGPGKPLFGEQDTSKLWLDWWAAHHNDPQWNP